MLVLSRRLNEKIVLPSLNLTIQIVAVKPGMVRLGIEAPAEVKVFREELLGRDESATVADLVVQPCSA
jgi:carbon storage regulator